MIDQAAVSSQGEEIRRRWRRTAGDRFDPPLTPRQRQFLRDVCQGFSYREIAELRQVSRGTVKSTIHDAHTRLGIVGEGQMVRGLICWCIGVEDGTIDGTDLLNRITRGFQRPSG